MKKIKVLTSLVGLTGLSMGLVPTIASCSCSNGLQVEMISKQKERNFNANSGGSSWAFKLGNEATAKATKVKMINLKVDGAETKTVAGLIKTNYDSAGNLKVTVRTDVLSTQWPDATKFEFNLLFTNKDTGKTVTFDGFILNSQAVPEEKEVVEFDTVYDFTACNWSIITGRVNAFYSDSSITEKKFCNSFSGNDGETPLENFTDFIGLVKELTIQSIVNKFMVIGVQHDQIHGSTTKALFTFQCKTILAISDTGSDNLRLLVWGDGNKDYTTSQLRKNLNSTGQASWVDISNTKSVLQMIPNSLSKHIKVVDKQVATYQNTDFVLTDYYDKIFPLTATEFDYQSAYAFANEGKPYAYWTAAKSEGSYLSKIYRHDAKNNDTFCWTGSPYIDGTNFGRVWGLNSGGFTSFVSGGGGMIDFAFCI